MAFDTRRTYLCYSNRQLIRDGYIPETIIKEYIPASSFNRNKLKNPSKGVSYSIEVDAEGNETIKEKKKQLPASKIQVEIDFSKVMKNVVTHPIAPGDIGFSPMASMIATPILSPIGSGGITSGLTYVTIQLLESETKINYPVVVTEDIINTGVIEFNGFPLSVFGVVKGVDVEDENGNIKMYGLNFTEDQKKIIGKYSDGVWEGTKIKRINGATDSDGLFGGSGTVEVKFDDVKREGQEQLFIKILKDDRKIKFRADNYDATGARDYPYKLTGTQGIDATDNKIKIKTEGLVVGDRLYITFCIAYNRYVRQNLLHMGKVAQGNTVGIAGFMGVIATEVDAFDYQMKTWKVPALPYEVTDNTIDTIKNYYTSDQNYKLSLPQFIEVDKQERADPNIDTSQLCDKIEGWRLSESITNRYVKKFWAADYRGILLYDNNKVSLVLPASSIRDKIWFENYLKSLDFITPTGSPDVDGNPTYLSSDFAKKIEQNIDTNRQPGFLFDLSEIANSLLFDREKIPYYRPFANALKKVSKYNKDDSSTGVGVISLDILQFEKAYNDSHSGSIYIDLSCYDLSYSEFLNSNGQPQKNYSCDTPFDLYSHHYSSQSYDANNGPGAWYDAGYIENQVFEWRPQGGTIETYWKMNTPYFCGSFSRKTRVYVEKMFGPSLDNYSWIYIDTEPFIPHNISLDNNDSIDTATLVFNDDITNAGLCYHKLNDGVFDIQSRSIVLDKTKSHLKEDYDHNKFLTTGQNRIIGDLFDYSNGIPIVDDVNRICEDDLKDQFWWTEVLYEDGDSDFGIKFSESIPKMIIPTDWYIRNIEVEFSYEGAIYINEVDKYVSFYFEDTDSSIGGIKMFNDRNESNIHKITIDFKYYPGGTIQILGQFWKKVIVNKISGRFTSINNPDNTSKLDLDNYKIKSGQSATVYDGFGRLFVFYANSDTGNIDVAMSFNDGTEWIIHRDLIRIINGEVASLPFAIKDINSNYIHLFYVLNDSFLMSKRINTDLFIYEDSFLTQKIPDTYEDGDYDQALEDPERAYWGEYSLQGLMLRRFPSYFIAGYYDDAYFKKQMDIRDSLYLSNKDISNKDKMQTPRFEFSGNKKDMEDAFSGDPYSIIVDKGGVLRLFFVSNGKLSIKRSDNFFSWVYEVKEQIIHKNYIDEEQNKGFSEDIQNIQVIRDDYGSDLISLLYFNNGMLFMRHFSSNLLFPWYDSNGVKHDEQSKDHLSLTETTVHRPIFLVGKIPEQIRATKIDEIDNDINDNESSLYIQFYYDREMINNFDDKFSIDTDTQVYAYTMGNGLIRIFYKDSFGYLDGIIVDALKIPILEVMNVG